MVKVAIKDIELRNIVAFKGHEEEPLFQGDIYYHNCPVGWFSEDAWGGDSHIRIKEPYYEIIENLSKEYLQKRYKEEFLQDLSTLFTDILALNESYRFFKEQSKKGMQIVAVVTTEIGSWLSERVIAFRNEKCLQEYLKTENMILVFKYTSLKDFNVK